MKNNFPTRLLVFLALVTIAIGGLLLSRSVDAAQFFGAIYTTLGDGQTVNQNVYDSKEDVYLNGGPQNPNAQGLPDGTYYFQVTDPSGQTLLSTDDAECRQVLVVDGKMAGATGPCPHANATLNDANGSLGVQLIPYNDTPNPGGEYKVWLIRQTDSTSIEEDGIHIIFNNNDAKTDNFKVRCTGECGPTPTPTPTPDFSISGMKFFDINADGIMNGDDFALPGFLIRTELIPVLVSNPVDRLTESDGTWEITGIPNLTDYWTYEVVPNACDAPVGAFWQQTLPSATDLITPPSMDPAQVRGYAGTIQGLNVTDLDFGNRCVSPGTGGHTLGFWSNKNGQALIIQADLEYLSGLNLVNADGSPFNNFSKAQYKTWLLNGTATNMAYMLSVQMSATVLNVRHEFIDGDALIDVGGQIGTINGWIAEANSSLDLYPNTTSPHAQRADQERLKNIFDGINNNNFVFIHTGCTACYPE